MKRRLTPEEQELWQYVTRNDTPLHPYSEPPMPDLGGHEPRPKAAPVIKKYRSGAQTPVKPSPATAKQAAGALTVGSYARTDGTQAEKLKNGRVAIEATIDLHGMTLEQAHRALERFISQQERAGARLLLVITGKGKSREGQPVLRQEVPRWLAQTELSSRILVVDVARAQHGGQGAYYVLLKRKRS